MYIKNSPQTWKIRYFQSSVVMSPQFGPSRALLHTKMAMNAMNISRFNGKNIFKRPLFHCYVRLPLGYIDFLKCICFGISTSLFKFHSLGFLVLTKRGTLHKPSKFCLYLLRHRNPFGRLLNCGNEDSTLDGWFSTRSGFFLVQWTPIHESIP